MAENQVQSAGGIKNVISPIIIAAAIATGYGIYFLLLGAGSNFEGGDSNNHPVNTLGTLYKGGILVGFAISLLLMVVTFSIERIFTLAQASGKGSIDVFVKKIQIQLESENIDAAIAECDAQKGSVGHVVKSAMVKYKEMSELDKKEKASGPANAKDKESKILAIQKSLEEATALELPMLEKNLTIIATIVSIATLVGLIGTVLGMIKSFSAMANAGAPDPTALSLGISEALINTAIGITTSTIATVVYNYFTSRIDGMTYSIDEAGFSIVQTFAAKH